MLISLELKRGLKSSMRTTSHAFTVGVIVNSRCMGRTPDTAGEGADTSAYRRSRSRVDLVAPLRTAHRADWRHVPRRLTSEGDPSD
jgi:hypothetical protein